MQFLIILANLHESKQGFILKKQSNLTFQSNFLHISGDVAHQKSKLCLGLNQDRILKLIVWNKLKLRVGMRCWKLVYSSARKESSWRGVINSESICLVILSPTHREWSGKFSSLSRPVPFQEIDYYRLESQEETC